MQDKKEIDKKRISRRTSRRIIDQNSKDSSDMFCTRSAQKYRIRSMSRSSERPPHPLTQSNTLEINREIQSEQRFRKPIVSSIEPWYSSG